jgi:hypothetical protein
MAQYEYPGEEPNKEVKQKKSKYANSKLFFGGNFGLWFGSITSIELDPIVGYMVTPRLALGLGPMYMYYKEYDLETSIYGGKIFGQFTVFKDLNNSIKINLGDIFIYAENELLNIEPIYYDPITNWYYKQSRKWIDLAVLGFGIRYPIGPKAGVSLYILWDISQNPEYSYQNPDIRIGFNF